MRPLGYEPNELPGCPARRQRSGKVAACSPAKVLEDGVEVDPGSAGAAVDRADEERLPDLGGPGRHLDGGVGRRGLNAFLTMFSTAQSMS